MPRRIVVVIAVIIITVLALAFYSTKRKYRKKMQKETEINTSSLGIENYIFTKLGDNKALIRVYGINNNNKAVSYFPIIIDYYSKEGELLGSDKVDLLKKNDATLKPMGRINAEIHIVYPQGTEKVGVRVDREG